MLVWRSKKKYKSPYTGKEVDASVGKGSKLPVITAADVGKILSVDSEGKIIAVNMSGGSSYYMHLVIVGNPISPVCILPVVVNKSTALTINEVVQILYDAGFTSRNAGYPIKCVKGVNSLGEIQISELLYVENRTDNVIKSKVLTHTPTITNNQLSYETVSLITSISGIADRVFPCDLAVQSKSNER